MSESGKAETGAPRGDRRGRLNATASANPSRSAGPEVVRAGAADVPAVAPLFNAYREFYGQAPGLDACAAFLEARLERRDSIVLLALVGEQPAGFVQLYPSFSSVRLARTFILNDLFVAEQWRSRGVGSALMESARAFARSEAACLLTLSTGRDNRAAQTLYLRQGWVEDEEFLTYSLIP